MNTLNSLSNKSGAKHTYVLNDPINLIDPFGRDDCVWSEGDEDATVENGGDSQSQCEAEGGTWLLFDEGSGGGDGGGTLVDAIPIEVNVSAEPIDLPSWDSLVFDTITFSGDIFESFLTSQGILQPNRCTGFVPPVKGPITAAFGSTSATPGVHDAPHTGVDYGVPVGTPVVAPFPGTVTRASPTGGFGNLVAVNNPDGTYMLGHLSSIEVHPGQQVSSGQTVGLAGNTGRTFVSAPGNGVVHFEQHGPGPIFNANGKDNHANLLEPCK